MIIVDYFCGAGGAAVGMHQALDESCIPHTIIGVDIRPQPHYPFEFIQADALTFSPRGKVHFRWYSPPCHRWVSGVHNKHERPDCLTPLRPKLHPPFCIENVPAAPLYKTLHLCGTMFGLHVFRHRCFETSFHVIQPVHRRHRGNCLKQMERGHHDTFQYYTVAGKARTAIDTLENRKWAMGVDWECTNEEVTQMVPPAYSRYIMQQFLISRTNKPIIRESGISRQNGTPKDVK